jgi:hypothetical protein
MGGGGYADRCTDRQTASFYFFNISRLKYLGSLSEEAKDFHLKINTEETEFV